MKHDAKLSLIGSIISCVLCLGILVVTIFAWYIVNTKASATGLVAKTSDANNIKYTDTVVAVRHSLDGNVTTNTYERKASGELILTTSITVDDEGESIENEVLENTKFWISEILPGEYIDVTIGFYMSEGNTGKDYSIQLREIYGEEFEVDGKKHTALGAFKYSSVSLNANDVGKTSLAEYDPDEDYWLVSYDIEKDDENISSIELCSGKWDDSYGNIDYTFRIKEDFSQYYQLINRASEGYGNLLSKKEMKFGQIYILGK